VTCAVCSAPATWRGREGYGLCDDHAAQEVEMGWKVEPLAAFEVRSQ
jgi:hypothetical protein